MKKLAVLVSGGGTNLQAVIDGIAAGEIDAQIGVVLSNKPGAYALVRAEKAGIPTVVVERKNYPDKVAFDTAILTELKNRCIEGVVLAGYMAILDEKLVREYKNRIINIHPSLIPSFCGMGYYGHHVHEAVLAYGAKLSGATTHFVDEEADTGPIIMQAAVPVLDGDTPESLAARVLEQEHKILPRSVALFCKDKLQVDGRWVNILD